MGLTAGVDECGKSRPHRDSMPGPSSPWRVSIPTELPRLQQSVNSVTIPSLSCSNVERGIPLLYCRQSICRYRAVKSRELIYIPGDV